MNIKTETLHSGHAEGIHYRYSTRIMVSEPDELAADRAVTQIIHLLSNDYHSNGTLWGEVERNGGQSAFEICFMYCQNDYHLNRYGTWEQYLDRVRRRVDTAINSTDFRRDTNTSLMKAVYTIALRRGYAGAFESIKEYFLPETMDVCQLTSYQFDFRAIVNYGCEGTWLNCYLEGDFGIPD